MHKLSKLLRTTTVMATLFSPLAMADDHSTHTTVDHSHRSEANQQRDEFRQPYRTLAFFGVKPEHKVIEILPGGGWYTEILAPMLKEDGELIAAHYSASSPSEYRKRSRKNFEEKMAGNDAVYGNVVIRDFDLDGDLDTTSANADMVLTFRGLHGLQNAGDLAAAFDRFNAMLKAGGKLGVVQHQAPEGYNPIHTAKKGYLPKSHVIAVARAAGFELVAEGYFHNNHKDTIIQDNVEGGVWTLPPNLNTDTDKEKYAAMGESNRMTLLFKKL
ncbi:methyltransferase [Alteromonas sp. ASW11-19]|uniref:Methyltransferase n=1 Tax=Alteromonas salexigens TaxID=2982530 RepID=A0ABT2VRH4_9ALTE|nr:methyltransferase [Alteromonas salexigens]MCU7555916.1 methyltransferase [Alteromonas salexigens]